MLIRYVAPFEESACFGFVIACAISDYFDIAEEFGGMEAFKKVLDGAHERGMKVIMDLVVNHTSTEHEWFKKSIEDPTSEYHNYYHWRKGKGKNGKRRPNNWMSTFAGPAWGYNEKNEEYYLHLFAVEQPDLNMDNPEVREEVKDILRFWLDMGVDGFREDVITFISKKEGLPSSPYWFPVATGIENYMHGPHLDEYLMEFKTEVLDKYDCMTVGEAPMMTTKKALKHITEGENQQLNMMFHFEHMAADCMFYSWFKTKFKLKTLKKVFSRWQKDLYGKAWNAYWYCYDGWDGDSGFTCWKCLLKARIWSWKRKRKEKREKKKTFKSFTKNLKMKNVRLTRKQKKHIKEVMR